MRKIIVLIPLILLMFIISCVQQIEPTTKKTLSELQIEACNAAYNSGTCDSRLNEVGIVLGEECCEVLGKCC